MEYIITEKQFKLILSKEIENKDLEEQDAETVSPEPTAGTSDAQSGGQGYPEVGKWESGATRGPGNQIGVSKWSDIVGSTLKRGKANPLKEQITGTYKPDQPQIPTLDKHTSLEILALVSGFLSGGLLLPFILGAVDAKLYWDEGDKKTAGLVGMFSILPGVFNVIKKIPIIKQLGVKGMKDLAVKLSKGQKINNPSEINVLKGIAQNKDLIKQEITKKLTAKGIVKGVAKTGLELSPYIGAGIVYDKTYDYHKKKEEEENIKKLMSLIQQAKK